ncbi:hypothetical protein MNB_SV-13-638 [hydrothermal vent metagenome]|uniref:Uncharacterized protein n=1 Tax=hydrothermal vent metagenome TaxID=652676 RepID=A0A1W1CCH4_9ZZZZ
MKHVGLTLAGTRYEIKLADDFAEFVIQDLASSGINFNTDNKAETLLKAYLHLAKQASSHEDEIELLIDTLDGM